MTRKHGSDSAFNPDQPRQPDNVAVNDRIAARGADYARENNASAEGNDPALIAGPSFVRQVNADGSVEAAASAMPTDADANADRPHGTTGEATPAAGQPRDSNR